VGTDVAQPVGGAGASAAEQHRFAQDLVTLQLAGLQVVAQGSEIPDVAQEAFAEPDGRGG
jgi:hypothetical protein